MVKRALGKEQIDEVIKITEKYKEPSKFISNVAPTLRTDQ